MAKKKSKSKFKFSYDAPVSLSFGIIAILLFLLDTFVLKSKLNSNWLMAPTAGGEILPFAITKPVCYVQILLHVFGGTDPFILISNLIFIILLGPDMENRYGSVVIGIMIFVASLFSGVLNACCCKFPVSGAEPVVFMLIILDIMMHLTKKTISASSVAVVCLFVAAQLIAKNPNGVIGVMITLAGGLCGSLLAFMASPKARAAKKQQKVDDRIAEIDGASPRFANKKKNQKEESDSDETIVGTIKF